MFVDYDWNATMEEEGGCVTENSVPLLLAANLEIGDAALGAGEDGGRAAGDVDPNV